MNQSIYTSAYYSLVIQFIIAIICLLGTFIKVDNQDKILREVLVLETVVQFIEFSFYLWLVYNFNNIKIDISVVRYYDWFLTTPTMLFALICFMVYFHKTPENNSTTEEMCLENIYHENSSIIHKILVSNALMLLLGYLGELNIISKVTGFLGGTFFLLYAFYYLYVTFVQEHSINKYLFWFNFILWSGYGIAYLLSHENKNNVYNILDVFAKNINGLFILLFIIYKYYL
jgi:bacteriorhodopsin